MPGNHDSPRYPARVGQARSRSNQAIVGAAALICAYRLRTLTPVLPHLRMLLSLDGCSADGRPVRGCVIARRIGGAGGVAECPSHAASPPAPGSPAGAAPSAVRGMIVSAALRLSDRNKRCTMVCCGGANFSGECSARLASACVTRYN